jgi:MFS family permease
MAWGTQRVLGNWSARLYLTGVLISGFGTTAMLLVAGVWVKSLTGSSSLAALVALGVWLPTLFGPAIGVLADRIRRRPLLIGLHAGMAVLLLVLLAVTEARVWILFAVMLAYGVTFVLADAAEAAIVPVVVPGDLLGDFNGLRMTINEGMKLVAPLVGAALFAWRGGMPVVLLDAVTFAVAAVAFGLLRVQEEPPPPNRRWSRQLADGLGYLRRHALLRHLVLCTGAAMLLMGLTGAMAYAVVDDGLHRPPEFLGVLTAAQGVGSVVSGLATGPLLRRVTERRLLAGALVIFGLGLALRATPWETAVAAGSVAVGLGVPAVLIATMTAVQRETPGALTGRVAATANTVTFAPGTLALAAGAALLVVVDYRVVQIGSAALTVVLAAYCLWGGRPETTVRDRAPGSLAEPAGVPSGHTDSRA